MVKNPLFPIKNLDKDKVQEWKKFFPAGHIRLYPRLFNQIGITNEELFWKIIHALDLDCMEDEDILRPAVNKLYVLPVSYIQGFHDLLEYKIHIAKLQVHPSVMKICRRYYLYDLRLLYAICGTIAKGRDYFLSETKNPGWIPMDFLFQPLFTMATEAYELKTGLDDLRYGEERAPGWEEN